MEKLLSSFKIVLPASIYTKNPETSDLGKRIVQHSIELIDEIGFDAFTFKKLGVKINSNESSIYRYFDNKHKLLIYLSHWYWAWLEYQLVIETHRISDNQLKLEKAIAIISRPIKEDLNYPHINEIILDRIIINESNKSFHNKAVNQKHQEHYFISYKRLVARIKEIIQVIDIDYKYPTSLASTIVETAIHQRFLQKYFSSMTDCKNNSMPTLFLKDLVSRVLNG